MKPTLSDKVSIRRYNLPADTVTINFKDGYEIEIPSAIADLIALFDGKTTILQAINARISGTLQLQDANPLDELLIEMSSQEAIPTIRRLLEKKVLLVKEISQV
jgi:hypothetical protein